MTGGMFPPWQGAYIHTNRQYLIIPASSSDQNPQSLEHLTEVQTPHHRCHEYRRTRPHYPLTMASAEGSPIRRKRDNGLSASPLDPYVTSVREEPLCGHVGRVRRHISIPSLRPRRHQRRQRRSRARPARGSCSQSSKVAVYRSVLWFLPGCQCLGVLSH